MIRNPAVAGQFYPGSKDALEREIRAMVDPSAQREDAIGIVSPHAGYIYSGRVAGSVFSAISAKKSYVILGPNHTGLGETFGLDESDSWKTPIGDVEIDRVLADAIKKNCKYVKNDSLSHAHEHSIEVQIPFLQVLRKDFNPPSAKFPPGGGCGFRIVPIAVSYADLDAYRSVGRAIAGSIKELKLEREVTTIASSDMTHYESTESAKKKDSIAIKAILELDEAKLIKEVTERDISMCGWAPVAIMIVCAKALGASRARLVQYGTSGDASGDYSSVVGYAGMIIN